MDTNENVSGEELCHTSEDLIDLDTSSPKRKLKARLVYSKTELLNLRKSKNSQKEPDESTIATPKIILKVLKPDCKLVQKLSKTHDHSGIVLGPQKRSWNIGCHVSQPKRGQNESSGLSKHVKPFGDKPYTKNSESRRDPKNTERTSPTNFRGKDKNYGGKNSHYGFLRGCGKSDNKNKEQTLPTQEKEPEWFSEGPETINDTIELVGMNDDAADASKEKDISDKVVTSLSPKPSTSAPEIDSAILSVGMKEKEHKIQNSSEKQMDVDFSKLLNVSKPESSGSHFRHLFNKEDAKKTSEDSGNVNSKLLKLISCSGDQPSNVKAPIKPPVFINQQSSVNDLESTLRSILLGKQNIGSILNTNIRLGAGNQKNNAPTVEEIEAAAAVTSSAPKVSLSKSDVPRPLSLQDRQLLEISRTLADPRSWDTKTTNSQSKDLNPPLEQFDRTINANSVLQSSMLQPPVSLAALESMLSREKPTGSKLLSQVTSSVQSRGTPPVVGANQDHLGASRTWDDAFISASAQSGQGNLLLNGLLSKVSRTPMQPSSSYMHSALGVMPTKPTPLIGPPIQSSTRRPIVKSLHSDNEALMRSPAFPGFDRGYPTIQPSGMGSQNLRDLEAAVFQLNLKGGSSGNADIYQRNQNLAQISPGFLFPSLNRPAMTSLQSGGNGIHGMQSTSNGANSHLIARQLSGDGSGAFKTNYSAPNMLSYLHQQSRWLEHHNQAASCSSSDLFRGPPPGLRGDDLEMFTGSKNA